MTKMFVLTVIIFISIDTVFFIVIVILIVIYFVNLSSSG